MNKIEMCAVEYLYHTLDHEFAQIAVNSVNKELSGVAHAVINNELVKRSKRMNRRRAKWWWLMKDLSIATVLSNFNFSCNQLASYTVANMLLAATQVSLI